MEEFKSRYLAVATVVLALMLLLTATLFNLQIVNGEEYYEDSLSGKTRQITVKGLRGSVYDAKGNVLAYDRISYDLEFQRVSTSTSKYEYYTNIIAAMIDILEGYGDRLYTSFSIQRNALGEFEFSWGNISNEARAKRESNWRRNMYIPEKYKTTESVYLYLRKLYKIPEEMSHEDALKILGVWQEVQLSSYMAYVPVKIARGISDASVAEISMRGAELEGTNIVQSSSRVYPKGETASHLIGYTGRMYDDDTVAKYEEAGYSRSDLIGITGVEATMEDYLTGNVSYRQGKKIVEVNSLSQITRVLESEPATDGNNVYLTLDMNLQMVAEEALKKNIESIRTEQTEKYLDGKERYDSLVEERGGKTIEFAQTGAAVVLDVDTCNVLASASYPSYDANYFVGGLSQEVSDMLLGDPRNPLFNNATQSAATPGSIFKMITAIAGLEEGVIKPDEIIDCEGEYTKFVRPGAKGPSCWIGSGYEAHSNQNIVKALSNSCNYFFCEVAGRLGIDLLKKWAEAFGLTVPTGIQIMGERSGQIGSQNVLYDPDKPINAQATSRAMLVQRLIRNYITDVGLKMGVRYDQDLLNEQIEKMMSYYVKNKTSGSEITRLLQDEVGIPTAIIRSENMVADIASMMAEIKWDNNQTIVAGMGQSLTLATPIAIARYIAALVNGGVVYQTNIIDKITDSEGNIISETEPTVYNRLDIDEKYLALVKEGMREVVDDVAGGTAKDYFLDYKYRDELGGKTGTAQVSDIDLENNAWFVAFAPFDEPEIAVVVYIPHGYSGGRATAAAKEIIQYYLDDKLEDEDIGIKGLNELIE